MASDRRFDAAALILRAGLGVMFIAHALLKINVFTLPGTVKFFESVGLPGPLAYVTVAAELLGGAALILGIWSRAVALALVPVLIGATWVHAGNGWLFTAPNGGWEYPAFLTLAAIVVGLIGGGRYAVTGGAPSAAAIGGGVRYAA